jgi:glycosyltransferase involved in cell wall biosynthesis
MLVSVVIPAFNAAPFIEETLESVIRQSAVTSEIIVVNDGSTDNTCELVSRYGARVRLINQSNCGVSAARNLGVSHSTGEWIAFLDADDLWSASKLSRQLEVVNGRENVDVVHSWYRFIGDCNAIPEPPSEWTCNQYTTRAMLVNTMLPSCIMVRRSRCVPFRQWADVAADKVFVSDLLLYGARFHFLNEPLTLYRKHNAAMTRVIGAMSRSLDQKLRWARDVLAQVNEQRGDLVVSELLHWRAKEVEAQKWLRRWDRYWELRRDLARRWPASMSVPQVLKERVWPRWAYAVRDRVGHFIGR